jgi:RNA polymerase sigma-70 factor (ECF subfamily)
MPRTTTLSAENPGRLDAESAAWLARLRPGTAGREEAVKELHVLLLKAARFELSRRRGMLRAQTEREQDDLAHQSADDALVAVLGKLDDFRGDSRFTTWAYKFALLEAAVKARRRAWQGREVHLDTETWASITDGMQTPHDDAETQEIILALQRAVSTELSPHQRRVLVAITLDDIPIDVLAERLATTRGALYKTVHDARRKLREALAARGLDIDFYMRGRA